MSAIRQVDAPSRSQLSCPHGCAQATHVPPNGGPHYGDYN